MAFYYALSAVDPRAGFAVYGKGDDAEQAQADALHNIGDDNPDAAALRANLMVLTRAEAEERGLIPPGAPVIWYDHLRRYHVEDHAAPMSGTKPTGITSR
jgi:hypothetical protein